MSNPNKAKGTRGETKVVRYLADHGIPARRKALSGNKDQGDIEIPEANICFEVKTGKQTYNYNRAQLTEWMRQAAEEETNSGQVCFLVIVRHQRKISDAEVWLKRPESQWMKMEYLSDWVEHFAEIYR